MKKRILILLVITTLLAQSCYYRYWGSPSYKWKIDKNKILNYDYKINLIDKPTLYSPVLKLKLLKYPIYPEVQYIEYKEYEKNDSKKIKRIFIITNLIISLAGFLGNEATLGVGMLSISALIYFVPIDPNVKGRLTGNKKEVKTTNIKRVKSKDFNNASYERIKIIDTFGNSLDYKTDENGEFEINLVEDLKYTHFKKAIEVILKLYYKNIYIGKISLNIKNWTIPYIEIRKPIPIYGESKTGEVELGRAKPGDVFPILYEGEDLLKIQYNHQIGWISKDASKKFWAVPGYKQ